MFCPIHSAVENTETGEKLAAKRVGNTFEDLIDGKRVVREIRLLRQLRHENVGPISCSAGASLALTLSSQSPQVSYIRDLFVRTRGDEDDS